MSSSILLDALQIALEARELDMRASPYDLYSYSVGDQYLNEEIRCRDGRNTLGFNPEPILIETSEVINIDCFFAFSHAFLPVKLNLSKGKRKYQKLQMALYRRAAPVRRQIMECYAQAVAGSIR